MLEKSEAIVLRAIKFKETSLIVNCFTRKFGLQSFLVRGVLQSGKSSIKPAYFQLLNQLKLVIYRKKKAQLHTIKELKVQYHYKNISTSMSKQSVLMFLGEFLNESIREESPQEELYEFLAQGLILFDELEVVADFHLVFLLKLSKYLGFYPESNKDNLEYFDLPEGKYVATYQGNNQLNMQETILLNRLIDLNFSDLNEVHFSSGQRNALLSFLVNYYSLHLNGFKTPKSLEILKSLYR